MCKFLLLIFFALCSASFVAPKRHYYGWRHVSARAQVRVKYSPELLQDAKDFIKLIPSITIDELIAEHMIVDSGFRKAIQFLESSEFKQLQRRAEQMPEVIEVINFLHLNDTTMTTTAMSGSIRNQQQLIRDMKPSYSYDFSAGNLLTGADNNFEESVVVVLLPQNLAELQRNLGSFVSFTQELLTHLPRDRFVALINEKRSTGTVFPKFYEALRSAEFKQLIETTMKSKNVASLISILSSHKIDAQSLKNIAFDVISWGPSTNENSL